MTDLGKALEVAQEMKRREARRALSRYAPYDFQKRFHAAGASNNQIVLIAGNRVGKTKCGGAEVAMHLTGLYPAWWAGRRFTRPVRWWAAGATNPKTRDVCQRELCGNPEDPDALGTGMIPGEKIVETTRFPGVPNAYSSVAVRHVSGGISTLGFKSYEMGPPGFMSESLDGIWLDEESPMEIYSQCLARILDRQGMLHLTFTPEMGATELYAAFRQKLKPGQAVISATWDDAPHLDQRMQAQILEALPPHEREMRRRGIAQLGSGLVWPVDEEKIACDAFELPSYFRRIGGLDFGFDHPTAAAWGAHDPETDCFYVTDAYREQGQIIPVHASAIIARGNIPFAWPHDGQKHDSGSGEGLASQYRKEGVKMLPSWFTNPPGVEGEGSIAVEPGIQAILTAMEQGRFKVFRHLLAWFEEWRMYHRKDGLIVKVNDDLMSATRYAFQSRRFAQSIVRHKPMPLVAPVNPYEGVL